METSETNDPAISGLMSMVDYFLSLHPQQVQEGVHCLLTALSLHPPPRIEARARLQLGLVLYHHTNNLLEAREHLDKAMLVAQSAANLEDVRFEAASVAARILLEQNCFHQAKSLLRGKLEGSSRFPYWHVRLMLQLADVYACERDESSVVSTLDRCVEYTRHTEAPYTRLLCLLYKGAYQLTHKRYHEAGEVLNMCSTLLEEYQGERATLLRTFYLVIQVTHLLSAGQVKTAKPHLKQLQQCVKILSTEPNSSNPPTSNTLTAESFEWLTREQAYVIVYLVSMMHSVQAGYTEKALSYADKAMQFIDQQKVDIGVVSVLKAHLLENIILCLLVQGNSSQAIDKLHETVSICHAHPQLVYSHRAVLHTLLGLYAFATDGLDRAISQFHTALQHTNSGDLRVFVSLNLAVAYMKMGEERSTELSALMQSLETPTTSCQSLLAAVHYVKGLHSFCQLKLHEAKRHLRETLVTSNSGDLNKLTTCSLILLGQIFLSLGNTKETMDMVNPAMQLASKIPDKKLQVWAATLLADLYHLSGDQSSELSAREKCSKVLEELRSDQTGALKSSHHSLVQWTVGEWPVVKPASKPIREDLMLTSPGANVFVRGDSLPAGTMSPRKNEVPLLDGLKLKHGTVHLESIATTPERVINREVPQSARTLYFDGTHTYRSEQAEVDHTKVTERLNSVAHKRPPEHDLQSPLQKQQHLPSSHHRTPSRKRETPTSIRKNAPASLSLENSSSSSPVLRENPNGANSASPTLRGSPVPLKTPEIRLTKINGNSPFASSPRQLQFPPQLTAKQHTQSLAPKLTTQQHTQSPVPKLTTQQHTQSPVPKLTTQQHTQSPVPKLTTQQHTQSPVPNAPDLQHTTPPQLQPQPQFTMPMQMQSSPLLAAAGGSPYQNMASLSSPKAIINPNTSPTPPHQLHSPTPNPHSPMPSVNQMQGRSSTSPHQQRKPSPRSPIVQSHSPQVLYHQQQEALLLRHQQQQQQLQQQAHVLAQQQNVLQHYNPQTLQHMHSLSPSMSEQQQQLQQQRLFQQQQQAFQQQMMLQQAQAQQQYFLQQASMRNHQQAMLAHSPSMHLQTGMTQYAVNPSGMPPALHHSLGSPSSKQVHGQPHLSHMNILQRLSQEPSRSSLCAMTLPQGHSMSPVMNSYGSPYHGQSVQLLPNGSNMQGVNPNLTASPLRHYSPQGHMPG